MTKYAGKFHFEIPSDWWENCKKIWGILFAAPVCYTNSSLALAGIYTYISLRFTQSNSPTHTKSLLSFRNTRIPRISRQSVSAGICISLWKFSSTLHCKKSSLYALDTIKYSQLACRLHLTLLSNLNKWTLLSFRHTHISWISRQSVSASSCKPSTQEKTRST